MEIPLLIPFAIAAVVMLWAAWGTFFAFTGGIQSGLPLILDPPEERDVTPPELDQAGD